jgi:hypothetical protein
MAHPTYGFRTYKGQGSRLLRDLPDNDWVNLQAREGTSGWKKGLLFTRTYAYQEPREGQPGHHLYRYEVCRMRGLERVAEAYGRTFKEAREALYADLKRKGVMPDTAEEE